MSLYYYNQKYLPPPFCTFFKFSGICIPDYTPAESKHPFSINVRQLKGLHEHTTIKTLVKDRYQNAK